MKFKTTPETDEAVAKLVKFFDERQDGEEVSWLRIEAEAGVTMDPHGRNLARRALHKLRRPYAAMRGVGVQLSSPDNALSIMGQRFIRIDNATRRAGRTQQQLSTRHLEQMEESDRAKLLTLAGFFGAVRAFAKEAEAKVLPAKTVADE